ncbi:MULTISPECIES: competence type IV pilus minor pilin ComGG [Bacillus]|uniref:Probably part of the DNA transport machinery n=1 Tax=Bacillus amyloliquefaciens (strain Y2) TaxID=1155777 RepID=I2C7P9_BACAY|nr:MULTISPECIES: competence type IV pilus minor pilin ComGG [Bacillus]AFJ62673.1 probably part of the DNA transport machinery [Bacillus velezensis YAU B9601-Y2]AJE79317.1 competence protein ComG [Bacillus sp. BH072]AUG36626.1 competence protein ComG [Bacillus velezensis]KFI17300.1 competence protein ComG [Bacillus velezensis]MBL4958558.1 competence protein ComG [Bacillus velezensis]
MYKSDGFIYPAVLFVSAAVLLVISYTSSDFITRKTFAKEAGEYWIGENLLQNGALLSSRHMTQGQKGQTGTQRFPYGTVSFHITGSDRRETVKVTIQAETMTGTRREATLLFDQKKKQLIQWTEV